MYVCVCAPVRAFSIAVLNCGEAARRTPAMDYRAGLSSVCEGEFVRGVFGARVGFHAKIYEQWRGEK